MRAFGSAGEAKKLVEDSVRQKEKAENIAASLRAEEAGFKSKVRQLTEENTKLKTVVLELQGKVKKLKKKH